MNKLVLITAALAAAHVSAAELPPLGVAIGYASEVYTGREYDLVDDDDHLPLFKVGAAWTLVPAKGLLDVELQYRGGRTSANVHQVLSTELILRGVEAGATWRYPLFRHLEPYGRLSASLDWATLNLGGEARLNQTVARPGATGMAGVQLPIALRRSEQSYGPVMLLDLGVGYALRPQYGFHALQPVPPAKPPEDPIARQSTNLGSIGLSGISYRILVGLRL